MFTDIEGSTRLVEELGGAWGLALRICRRILVDAFAEHRGREFGNEGDGQFFVFSTPLDAVSAAVAAQHRITACEWPDNVTLRVRMGVHCGPVRLSGGVYVGMTLHEVARISGSAGGGDVLCSADVVRDIGRSSGFEFVDLGRYVLRGLPRALSLYQVRADGLPTARVTPRDAVRDGGRQVTIWRRERPVPDAAVVAANAVLDGPLRWSPRVEGVEVDVIAHDDRGTLTYRVTVRRAGNVEEEFDGLTVGGTADITATVNALSQFVTITDRVER